MEHRWNDRHPVKVNVVIHGEGVGLIRGRTQDIAVSGAFIQSANTSTLRKNLLLRLAVAIAGKIKIIRARVSRVAQGGFAVNFDPEDSETRQNVEMLVKAHALPELTARVSNG